MTKEEAIKKHVKVLPYLVAQYYENKELMSAMDEYAKQQAIAFGFYVLGADMNDPDMGGVIGMTDTYIKFIEQQINP